MVGNFLADDQRQIELVEPSRVPIGAQVRKRCFQLGPLASEFGPPLWRVLN